jgi:hypothetical protein
MDHRANAVLDHFPAKWLGGTDNARRFGWPPVDALVWFERNRVRTASPTRTGLLGWFLGAGGASVSLTIFCLHGFTGGDRNKWKLFASSSVKCRDVSMHHSES